jgi:glucose/mannose-6-phosphate isomerase
MMREIIYSLPNQIAAAVGFVPDFRSSKKRYNSVLVCGMGGSGISGEILSVVYNDVQIVSNKDYDIPGFVDKNTLAILVSYSGNTEETLNNYRQLAARKIDMVLLSSDGKLYAKKARHKVKVPPGLPPRGALGFLFTPLPIIMYGAGLIGSDPRKKLLDLVKFLTRERDAIEQVAQKLAPKFVDRLLILYSNSPTFRPVANRWQCQLNENAKVFAHVNVIPEMNHNEIVGLGRPKKFNPDALLVFLNDPGAHRRSKLRVRVLKELIRNELRSMVDVEPRGRNKLQRIFWTIMLGDFISYYVAVATGIDPMPVHRIDHLKNSLSKLR